MQWRNREKRNDQEHHVKASFFHLADKKVFLRFPLLVMLFVLKKCLLHFLLLVMLIDHVAKRSNSRLKIFFIVVDCRLKIVDCDIFKNRLSWKCHNPVFTGKHLCWNHFLIMFQDWRPALLFRKRLQHRRFSVIIVKFLRTVFL